MLRWAEIHLNRLFHNYREIKKISGRKKIFAVVKANAYGHGSIRISKFLEDKTDVSGFAVATFEEGKELREARVRREILVMASHLEEGYKEAVDYRLTPVIFDFEGLKLVKELNIPFHVKIDTGMGRLGFLEDEWNELLSELKYSKVEGIMSHFSSADEDLGFTREQFKKFYSFASELKQLKPEIKIHIDNSAAIPIKFDSILTHCRVGIALYGSKPYSDYPLNLKQVMEVKAKVISVKNLPSEFPISYSKTYKTSKREKVAVISFGYADGLLRSLSNKGEVLINGKRCPIRGRICMDMTIVSVEGLKVRKGDTAVISGEKLTFEEIAEKAGTIPYEIMCDISPRVKRIYHEGV
ncbi:alanine racemase [Desulfurobacterium thermolithotrophum]|uniref:alanine racemase n=1 Tax=Desulfurobacterium thermolithotrophum TaxID=64160 RepID=UPI0013D60B5E|nr:alanine racemase [Desulfurobacterium thermolithotrophum]